MLESEVAGSERILVPGVEVVSEVVGMAVTSMIPPLMHTLYLRSMDTDSKPYV